MDWLLISTLVLIGGAALLTLIATSPAWKDCFKRKRGPHGRD